MTENERTERELGKFYSQLFDLRQTGDESCKSINSKN
jgi:hypothetical protein